MKNLKIVEYNDSYASKVADMWQKSIDGWTGTDMMFLTTEEQVIEADKNNDYINKYLAKLDDEIVGYCVLEKFSDRTVGISLLNTRFDFHGKGIGKKLVIKAIERAEELGYEEIDLYTWPGNTKSIPLYKKCGFMYEKNQKQTFLRNFIPGIISNNLFKDFFKNVDWYKGLKRKIDLEWDDITKDSITYYEYLWEQDNDMLRLNFEKKSSGLCLIETKDYLISAKVKNQSLIYGQSYSIYYEMINKTGKPLRVQLIGQDDRNIKYNAVKSVDIVDKLSLKEEFIVDKLEEDVSHKKEVPAVITKMIINDKYVDFKIGIETKEAVTLSINKEEEECHLNKIESFYLDVENNVDEEIEYTLELVDNDNIKIINKIIKFKFKGLGKNTVKIEYVLNKFMIYDGLIKVKGKFKDGRELNFETQYGVALRGRGCRFGGQTKNGYIIANDKYLVSIGEEFFISFKNFNEKSELALGVLPTLGEPWAIEFYDKKPNVVQWDIENSNMVMKITFDSNDFKGIELVNIFKLSPLGVLERYCEVKNVSYKGSLKDLKLKHEVFIGTAEGVIPHRNKYINLNGTKNLNISYINSSDLTENWMYLKRKGEVLLLYWDKDIEISSNEFYLELTQKLDNENLFISKPICMCFNSFDDWREAREYVMQDYRSGEIIEEEIIDIKVNEGNPFICENFMIRATENLKKYIDGKCYVKSQNGDFESQHKGMKDDEKEKEIIFNINTKGRKNIDIIDLKFNRQNTIFDDKKLVFIKGKQPCKGEVLKEGGCEVYQVNNGVLNIKLSPDFAPSLYSVTYDNQEILDSSFPMACPKGWYNPWFGGIGAVFKGMNAKMLKDQLIKGEIVNLKDNFNNEWMGIKSSIKVIKHETLNGLIINQYYMVMSKVPILVQFVELQQNTGVFIKSAIVDLQCFLKTQGEIEENYLICKNTEGKLETKRVSNNEDSIRCGPLTINSSDKVDWYMHGYIGESHATSICNFSRDESVVRSFKQINIPNGKKVVIGPKFYIISDNTISENLLTDLNNIKFEI